LEDMLFGITAGMASSVPAFFLNPLDLLEYQPYYAEFKIMLS